MHQHLYQKCLRCHLFIEANDADEPGLAEFVHLHRGDEADEQIDASHEPEPSGMLATLETWKVYGPEAMRERFVVGKD
jgi:hypothetical protein